MKFPPHYVHPHEWPDLLSIARVFASDQAASAAAITSKEGKEEDKGKAGPRFAVLRLWSALHFYPLMIRYDNRRFCSFLDPLGRFWEWKYIPKDGFSSEWDIYNTLRMRLDLLTRQFGGRVVYRGDVVLVMGTSGPDLLRHAVAVTFAIQTKPWLREIDL